MINFGRECEFRIDYGQGPKRKKWTEDGLWRYKKKSVMGSFKHTHIFSLGGLVLCVAFTTSAGADESAGLKGLFKGRSSAAATGETHVHPAPSGEVVSAPMVSSPTTRPGEGNRFASTSGGEVRIPRNADKVTSKPAVASPDQKSPFNPRFGMPEFVPEDSYSSAAMSKGGLATARGGELTRFTPVEIREDRNKPEEPVGPVPPTQEELRLAAERKKDLFDEIYTAKSPLPPLTFESTRERIPVGPDGVPVATRNVGDRTLKQYVPLTKGKTSNR